MRARIRYQSKRDAHGIDLHGETIHNGQAYAITWRIGATELKHSWLRPAEQFRLIYRQIRNEIRLSIAQNSQ